MENIQNQLYISETLSFVNSKIHTVKISANNAFLDISNNKTQSFTYYGNFQNNIGLKLNARLRTSNNDFEIRIKDLKSESGFKHLDYSEVLEVILPTGELQLVKREGNHEFKIMSLGNIMSLNNIMPTLVPALSLNVEDDSSQKIKAIESNYFESKNIIIEEIYRAVNLERDKFHLGFIRLERQMPQPYFSLLKREMAEIVKSKIIENINNSNFIQLNNFSISAAPSGTILIIPHSPDIYKTINLALRNCLNGFNSLFNTNYMPDSYTGNNYQPHITLLHRDVVKVLIERLSTTAENLAKDLKREFCINRNLTINLITNPRYNVPIINDNLKVVLEDAKASMDISVHTNSLRIN